MEKINNIFDDTMFLRSKEQLIAEYQDLTISSEQAIRDMFNNAVIYKDNIEAYERYIKLIAYFLKSLVGIDNSISLSIVIKYLIEEGIFSEDKFIYTDKCEDTDIVGHFGINVIRGYGCCRHVARFHKDVFDEMHVRDAILYCYLADDMDDKYANSRANHVMNLIQYCDNLYCYDIIRDELFKFTNDKMLEGIHKKTIDYAYYKPYVDVMLNGLTCKDVIHLLRLFDTLKNCNIISFEEYKAVYYETRNLVLKNRRLIDEFKNDTKVYKRDVLIGLK